MGMLPTRIRCAALTLLLAAAGTASAVTLDNLPWVLEGTAIGGNTGDVKLTQNTASCAGAMWEPCVINVTENFDLVWTLYPGDVDYNCGGDGMAFVLQGLGASILGNVSGEHGYGATFTDGLAVFLDTYQNSGSPYLDPGYESLGIVVDGGDADAACTDTNGITGPCRPPALPGGANVTDGNFHQFEVQWAVSGGNATLSVLVDSNPQAVYAVPNYSQYFANTAAVYFGFTASSGSGTNWQQAALDSGSTVNGSTAVTALGCGANTPTPNTTPSY